jgi:hypothetical protein
VSFLLPPTSPSHYVFSGNEHNNQQWRFDGLYIRYNANGSSTPDKCIDVTGADTTNGAKLQIWDCECLADPYQL